MKTLPFSAAILAALTLSACGSGGGGSPSVIPTTPAEGHIVKVNPADSYKNISIQAETFSSNGNINSLYVDGQQVLDKIIPEGCTSSICTSNPGGVLQRMVGGNNLSHTRFGYVRANDNLGYVFASGQTTPEANIPHTGYFTYNGHYVDVDPASNGDKLSSGEATFNVNFGNRTIVGQLLFDPTSPMNINGTITDNKFNGTLQQGTGPSGGEVKGRFYGPNAEELGGTYYFKERGDEYSGAFGAKR